MDFLVGKERLELSILAATASKTVVYSIPPLPHFLVPEVGIEPTFSQLSIECLRVYKALPTANISDSGKFFLKIHI